MKEYDKWHITKVTETRDGKPISVKLVKNKYEDKQIMFKWDGCIDIRKYYNGYTATDEFVPNDEIDYIHICNLQEHIKELQEVLTIAKDVLDKEDYENYYQ